MKFLILGEAESGKSTLVQSLQKRSRPTINMPKPTYKPDHNPGYLHIKRENEAWQILIAPSYTNYPIERKEQLKLAELIDVNHPPHVIFLLFDLNKVDALRSLGNVIGAIKAETQQIQLVGGHQIQLVLVGTKNDLDQHIDTQAINTFRNTHKIDHYHSINAENNKEVVKLFEIGESLVVAERRAVEKRTRTEQWQPIKTPLEQYVSRINSYKENYQKHFHFFKELRALNRQINYLTALRLLDLINEELEKQNAQTDLSAIVTTTLIQSIRNDQAKIFFSTDEGKKIGIIEKFIVMYITFGIHSTELNNAIKQVQRSLPSLRG